MAELKVCSIEGCGKPVSKRGYCNAHFLRWKRHGDPLKTVRRTNANHCGKDFCPAAKKILGHIHYLENSQDYKNRARDRELRLKESRPAPIKAPKPEPVQKQPKPVRPKVCTIEGCDKKVMAKGWCSTHYQRWRFHGDPNHEPQKQEKPLTCTVEGCENEYLQGGYCRSHYMRWYRHGDPMAGNASPKFSGEEGRKEYRRLHYQQNKEKYIEQAKRQPKEQTRKAKKKYRDNNIAKVRAHTLARKFNLKQATPNWLSDAQWGEMNAKYAEARRVSEETGIPHDVDHIVPLRGKIVCGLHVPWNMRVLPSKENQSRPRVYKGYDDIEDGNETS